MTLVAVPNLSEGRDVGAIDALAEAVTSAGARVLDTHSDPVHNRTVLTVVADVTVLSTAMVELALSAARLIDLKRHRGVHPRVGVLDVCPFVPHRTEMHAAVEAAVSTAQRIGGAGIPAFLYGAGAERELPDLRRGGLEGLMERMAEGEIPDFGPREIRPETGVVCVGARGPLIAFNVYIDGNLETAKAIAAK